MKKIIAFTFIVLSLVMVAAPSYAGDKPIQIALFAPVQIFPQDQSIAGLRLSLIYGSNANVTGLDAGLVTKTSGDFKGIQWGLVHMVDGNATGIQWGGVNLTDGNFTGIQYGWFNSAGHMEGLQLG